MKSVEKYEPENGYEFAQNAPEKSDKQNECEVQNFTEKKNI